MPRIVIASFALLLHGCQLFGPDTQFEEFDGFFPANLGDNRFDVINTLGQPDESWAGDCNCSGFVYNTGANATTEISFLDVPDPSGLIYQVSVSAPFNGETRRGLRIGASRDAVIRVLGSPQVGDRRIVYLEAGVVTSLRSDDVYYFGAKAIEVRYDSVGFVESFRAVALSTPEPSRD